MSQKSKVKTYSVSKKSKLKIESGDEVSKEKKNNFSDEVVAPKSTEVKEN